MNSIGGYFGLGENYNKLTDENYYYLNSCRNAILLLIEVNEYRKIFLPYYTCNEVVEVLMNNNIEIEFYHIDDQLEIKNFKIELEKGECLIYNNFFGIKNDYVTYLSAKYENLIIDNAQAFYTPPLSEIDTVYSPRKFLPLSDGGILYTKKKIRNNNFKRDQSYERCLHLLKRTDLGAKPCYEEFIKNEKELNDAPIMLMSNLTQGLLSLLNIEEYKEKRDFNFRELHKSLNGINRINISLGSTKNYPLGYPLYIKNGEKIKQRMIENKIFIPTFWSGVIDRVPNSSLEVDLVKNLILLPIDYRYGKKELNKMLSYL